MKTEYAYAVLLAAGAALLGASVALAHDLPLGDGKISSAPRQDYLLSCQIQFFGGGAHVAGEWIGADGWDPAAKPVVPGDVTWPNSEIEVVLEGESRIVRANNLPKHPTGTFPIPPDSVAYHYDRNPNSIRTQNILLKLPAAPAVTTPSCVPMGMIGFALTGVAIYNAVDAMGRDAPAYEIQDDCNGHPQKAGQYHYHDYSPCMKDSRGGPGGHSDLVGYALDGFGIYGFYGEDGNKLTNADLDACHGHVHKVLWDGVVREIYHYHMTEEYPYTVGCFRGEPVPYLRVMPAGPPGRL